MCQIVIFPVTLYAIRIIDFSHFFTAANEKPKGLNFQTFPKSVTVQEKESVEVECEILGKPTKVTWSKDNVPIGEDSSVYQLTQVDNKFRMKILRASHDDIGQYVVEAKDSSGVQVTAAFSVNLSFLSE